LEGADRALTQGLQRLRGTTERGIQARGYSALARVHWAKGEVERALLTLQQGDEWLTQLQISAPGARAWLAAQRARLEVWQGNLAAARRWAGALQLDEETPLGYVQRFTLVRLHLAQHQHNPQPHFLEEATHLLASLLVAVETSGWISYVIESCILQAFVCQAQGEGALGHGALTRALTLAEPQGYIRTFVDEGEPLRLLMVGFRGWIARQPPDEQQGRLSAYLDKLLATFGSLQAANNSASSSEQPAIRHPNSKIQTLIEPLSERELEVLRLVQAGFSNSEIADQLIVTVGTVKKHINNIFGKLGVSSRTQALVRAREQNLV
jgi:LuxR family transcriptional regulator, maltose regulon positive regulatory protein